jgi:hypothetical protein
MKLLLVVKGLDEGLEVSEDFSGDAALQAADDLSFALCLGAFGERPRRGFVARMPCGPTRRARERLVGGTVAARVSSLTFDQPGKQCLCFKKELFSPAANR